MKYYVVQNGPNINVYMKNYKLNLFFYNDKIDYSIYYSAGQSAIQFDSCGVYDIETCISNLYILETISNTSLTHIERHQLHKNIKNLHQIHIM